MKVNPSVFMRTKSGTKVYLTDNKVSISEQKRALSKFIEIYNKSFTNEEQKKIGNIIYHYNKSGQNWERVGLAKKGESDNGIYAGHVEISNKTSINKLNKGKQNISLVGFSNKSYNDEYTVIHELIHCKDVSNSTIKPGNLKYEQQTDFETNGRMSKRGFNQYVGEANLAVKMDQKGIKRKLVSPPSGYYSDTKYVRKLPDNKKLGVIVNGINNDRKLLTGSINTNIIGRVATTRAKKLFPKSFFNQKVINTNKKR